MATKRNFLKEFFKDRKMVGAVSPSTKFLAEKMLASIDFDKAKGLVELGPGTGVFTKLIIERMREDAKLLVFELNDEFYADLAARIDDPRVQIIHDSAENISKYLPEEEHGNQDAVISSLPLMVFPDELRKNVVEAGYNCLKPTGTYVQFQYSLQSKKFLETIYKSVKITFTIKNFPPAFVYTCKKK
jgi:phosphatidylethanolamine/phosphatidyl-N-methylethanolamine N-methyltransferase